VPDPRLPALAEPRSIPSESTLPEFMTLLGRGPPQRLPPWPLAARSARQGRRWVRPNSGVLQFGRRFHVQLQAKPSASVGPPAIYITIVGRQASRTPFVVASAVTEGARYPANAGRRSRRVSITATLSSSPDGERAGGPART